MFLIKKIQIIYIIFKFNIYWKFLIDNSFKNYDEGVKWRNSYQIKNINECKGYYPYLNKKSWILAQKRKNFKQRENNKKWIKLSNWFLSLW